MSAVQSIAIDAWEPDYGASLQDGAALDVSRESIDADVEVPAADWTPLTPPPDAAPHRLCFVDGVRRIDGITWVTDAAGVTTRGLAASWAAGVCVAEATRACVGTLTVCRGLFSATAPVDLASGAGTWTHRPCRDESPEALHASLQEALRALEIRVATSGLEADLVVIDGPLFGREHVANAIGYVKTHRVAYLEPPQAAIIGALAAGQRTPLFSLRSSWTRYACYLRLPGPRHHPWSGVVRVEIPYDQPLAGAARAAHAAAAALPRFASAAHKDPRAPQNLYPIAGLERDLRHRLGDPHFVRRALRAGARAFRAGETHVGAPGGVHSDGIVRPE